MFSQLRSYYSAGSLKVKSLEFCRCKQTLPSCRGGIYLTCYRISPLIRRHHCCCWLYTHKPLSPLNFFDILCLKFSARFSHLWLWEPQTTSLQKSSRLWRMGKANMGQSVTGGPWGSACMKCCTARLLSMQNPWWKPTGRSWTTRWADEIKRCNGKTLAWNLPSLTSKHFVKCDHVLNRRDSSSHSRSQMFLRRRKIWFADSFAAESTDWVRMASRTSSSTPSSRVQAPPFCRTQRLPEKRLPFAVCCLINASPCFSPSTF